MSAAMAALLVFGSVWLVLPATRVRIGDVSGDRLVAGQQHPPPERSLVESPVWRPVVCVLACTALAQVLAGGVSTAAGVPLGIALSWWLGRMESPRVAREREEVARDLPATIDLLAACIQVGRPLDQSMAMVSRALGGAVSDRLDVVIARLALGGEPLVEWRRLGDDPQLAPLARTVTRSLESGAPLAEGLSRLADDRRRDRRTQTQLRARNVGVKAAGPLAACFLPAFMLIGVVPTVAGAFSRLVL